MNVSNLIRRHVTSCSIDDNLERAAQLMWNHDIGCLPVIDHQGHVAGMVTDRDACMAAYTQGVPLRAIPVTSAMASQVFSCREVDDVDDVETMMRQHQIRRMPVIDDQGHPIGIISLNDIARAARIGTVPARDVITTLAAVVEPRPLVASA